MPEYPARYLGERGLKTPACLSAGVVLVACIGALLAFRLGPLAGHMLQHILLMSVAAPICAVSLVFYWSWAMNAWRTALLWSATCLQLGLLWAWHMPMLHAAAQTSIAIRAIMSVSLFLAAVGFWAAVLLTPSKSVWQAILALLVTSKLACLLSALLVFAPRQLYSPHGLEHAPTTLDDQQLAGLLMLTACPLSYVLAGTVLALAMINGLIREPQPSGWREPVAP